MKGSVVFPQTHKTVEATAIALGCPPELEYKTLLLKTLDTFAKGCSETERPPGGASFYGSGKFYADC